MRRLLAMCMAAVFSMAVVFAVSPQTQAFAEDYTEQSILADGKAWTYRLYSDHAELNTVYVSGTEKTPANLVIPDYTPAELGSLPITWYDCPGTWRHNNPYLVSIKFNRFITVVPYSAFMYCDALKTVDFGNAPIKTIEGEAFYGTSLTSIKLPSTVESIGERAFIGCRFKNLTLPPKLKTIGDLAFEGCLSQKKLVIPDSVKSIGYYALRPDPDGPNRIETLHIGKGIKNLDVRQWIGTASVTKITGCENVTTITTFPYRLKNIVIFKNVKKLAKGALDLDMLKKYPTIVIKSKKLTKKNMKGCISLNGNLKKVTFKISVGSKKANKQYLAKYKKFFTKKVLLDWTYDWDLKSVKKILIA